MLLGTDFPVKTDYEPSSSLWTFRPNDPAFLFPHFPTESQKKMVEKILKIAALGHLSILISRRIQTFWIETGNKIVFSLIFQIYI